MRLGTERSGRRNDRFRLLDGCVANGVFVRFVGTVIVRLNLCLPQKKLARGVGSARADLLRLCAMSPAGILSALRSRDKPHSRALSEILFFVDFTLRGTHGNSCAALVAFSEEILRVT